jgi:hypothetical protein
MKFEYVHDGMKYEIKLGSPSGNIRISITLRENPLSTVTLWRKFNNKGIMWAERDSEHISIQSQNYLDRMLRLKAFI